MYRNISSSGILIGSLDFSRYTACHLQMFLLPFQVLCLLFFLLYCPVPYCTSRTSRLMLDNNGDSGYSGLVPYFREKYSFTIMRFKFLDRCPLLLCKFFSIPFLVVFNLEWMLKFMKTFILI